MRERVVGVVVGEHRWVVQRELLGGVPDPVVGARLAEVVARGNAVGALRLDDREERLAGPVDDVVRRTRSVKTTTPGPSASARMSSACRARRSPRAAASRSRGVDEDVAADVVGEGIVGEFGVAFDLRAEVVEVEVGLAEPLRRRGVRSRGAAMTASLAVIGAAFNSRNPSKTPHKSAPSRRKVALFGRARVCVYSRGRTKEGSQRCRTATRSARSPSRRG